MDGVAQSAPLPLCSSASVCLPLCPSDLDLRVRVHIRVQNFFVVRRRHRHGKRAEQHRQTEEETHRDRNNGRRDGRMTAEKRPA